MSIRLFIFQINSHFMRCVQDIKIRLICLAADSYFISFHIVDVVIYLSVQSLLRGKRKSDTRITLTIEVMSTLGVILFVSLFHKCIPCNECTSLYHIETYSLLDPKLHTASLDELKAER